MLGPSSWIVLFEIYKFWPTTFILSPKNSEMRCYYYLLLGNYGFRSCLTPKKLKLKSDKEGKKKYFWLYFLKIVFCFEK